MQYFDCKQSAFHHQKGSTEDILQLIANRFISGHPKEAYTYRLDFSTGILCNTKGQYLFDFSSRFTEAEIGERCFAAGHFYSHKDRESSFCIQCYGPTVCKVNGETIFVSEANQESLRMDCRFKVRLKEGINEFLFSTEKTEIGFGFLFGNTMPQWEPTHFQAPLSERQGQAGFIYSYPSTEQDFPVPLSSAAWLPEQNWDKNNLSSPFDRIFGAESSGTAVAKTNLRVYEKEMVSILGHTRGGFILYVDGKPQFESGGGAFHRELTLHQGLHTLIVQYEKTGVREEGYSFHVQAKAPLSLYPQVEGYQGEWLYAGLFDSDVPEAEVFGEMNSIYTSGKAALYWKCDIPDGVVRIFAEQELYGRWTYPMGVTLYGLLKAGDWLKRKDYTDYVLDGARMIIETQEYALYDKSVFGYPGVNTQICWLDALDDCGSFGSLMLEAFQEDKDRKIDRLADTIAGYMRHGQKRESDGAFSRHDDTMWIDDMYMSIPFLCRYSKRSGDSYYLEEACRQALSYRKRFFIEEKNLMSHIFYTKYQKANQIPWSRGNGWVMFSLSELLEVLPNDNEYYSEITDFYNRMAKGILAVQDASGLWHQLLDGEDTYQESSSTAMFICALSRGYRSGYLDKTRKEDARKAVRLAWEGLTRETVNRYGDLYGVCQGSGCSFSRNYYKKLSWRFNDAHGIGIVLLAGIETLKLDKYLA